MLLVNLCPNCITVVTTIASLSFLPAALDAAGPSFEGTDPDCRLDETDALYVDAIHTDSNLLSEGGVGISQRVSCHQYHR